MHYITTTGWEDGTADLVKRLISELRDGKSVLWLLSGGSNIPSAVHIMDSIPPELSKGLSLMLADERYGFVGHPDSNWTQLKNAGLDTKQAKVLEILRSGNSFKQTAVHFETMAKRAFHETDIILAQLGIGEDGHTAGILPGSDASREEHKLVGAYEEHPFERLTLTIAGLRYIQAAYVFAFGENKHLAISNLRHKKIPLNKQPAQILKDLPEAYVYSDQGGEYS